MTAGGDRCSSGWDAFELHGFTLTPVIIVLSLHFPSLFIQNTTRWNIKESGIEHSTEEALETIFKPLDITVTRQLRLSEEVEAVVLRVEAKILPRQVFFLNTSSGNGSGHLASSRSALRQGGGKEEL
ncbi:hypothetical protein E2C01_002669 [Portunus trituberculatus]|uniref:Uncharacterized protein n=1 Tax=Portunus trituberculatus TaxID=210409 RepID=A0A5B7CRD4_PORTR|nr:hypothetical protein [Portunus trituberculatus]